MTAQMTEWYPPEVKPVRAGRYQTYREGFWQNVHYWNGTQWKIRKGDPWQIMQTRHWRGLAADPAVTK